MTRRFAWSAEDQLIVQVGSEEHVVERIRRELLTRDWSQNYLAARMRDAGHPIHASVLSRLLREGSEEARSVSISQLIGLSKVFEIPFSEMVLPVDSLDQALILKDIGEGPQALLAADTSASAYEALAGRIVDYLVANPDFGNGTFAELYNEQLRAAENAGTPESDHIPVRFFNDIVERLSKAAKRSASRARKAKATDGTQ